MVVERERRHREMVITVDLLIRTVMGLHQGFSVLSLLTNGLKKILCYEAFPVHVDV